MKILIATSGRSSSKPAVEQGAYIARVLNATPDVLLVKEGDRDEGETALEEARRHLENLGIKTNGKLLFGGAAEKIIQAVEEGGYDLLVLGQGHKPNLLERVFGDTTKRVLAAMPCPVLIVKGVSEEFKRILVCDSLATEGGLVKAFLDRFAGLLSEGQRVTILHVMSQMGAGPSVEGWELQASADDLINARTVEGQLITEDLTKISDESQVEPVAKVRHGMVVEEIVNESREGSYDLLVLGAHRGDGWQRFLLENLAGEIVSHSQVPVLVLPRDLVENTSD